jgi:hypothetical protein
MRVVIHPDRGLRDADPAEQVDGVLAGDLLAHVVVDPVRLDDLVAHRVVGMQRRQRVLEDHRHLAAAQLPHPVGTRGDQIFAVQPDLTGDLGLGPLVQSHDAHAGDALARARLAHDAQRPAAIQRERDPVHGPDQAVVGLEMDPQIADLEHGASHQNRTLGSTTAYRISTIILATTMANEAIMTTPMISGRS